MSMTVGIDISKDWLDVALYPGQAPGLRFPNDGPGHAALIAWLGGQDTPARIVFEATGAYHRALALALAAAGLDFRKVNPRRARRFAHLTLLQDSASPPAATPRAQARRFRDFQVTYNEERPHAALGNATPSERYASSPRRWDGMLRSPEPAPGAAARRVKSNGLIRWRGTLVYVSEALAGEPIGLDEGDDGLWTLRYGPIPLGLIADRGDALIRLPQKRRGLVDNAARCPQGPRPGSRNR